MLVTTQQDKKLWYKGIDVCVRLSEKHASCKLHKKKQDLNYDTMLPT